MRQTLLFALCLLVTSLPALAQQKETASAPDAKSHQSEASAHAPVVGERVACTNGRAADFACRNVDLLSFLPISSLGSTSNARLNDIWGWTDTETGKEYALVGRTDGTAFVDVSDPVNPLFLGFLPLTTNARLSTWRDIKVFEGHAYVVADNAGLHGVQVFDLKRLRSVGAAPMTFDEDTVYTGIGSAHNIAINEDTGFAYAVGSSGGSAACGPGLHMIDVRAPKSPRFAGCYAEPLTGRRGTGYTHDTQCVIYHGPDAAYKGREICVSSNETAVVISDVTDKLAPQTIGIASYPESHYAHQGWLTPDHAYFLLDDELDEVNMGPNARTRTLIWDLDSIEDPQLILEYRGTTRAIDHNQYIVAERAFQANYASGLRILDLSNITSPREVGYFDTFPAHDTTGFVGAWSNYPFFESGIVIVSSIGEGLFVLKPTGPAKTAIAEDELPAGFRLLPAYPNPFNPETSISLEIERPQRVRIAVYDAQGKEVAELFTGTIGAAGRRDFVFDASTLASGVYLVRATGETGTQTTTVALQK